MAGRARSSRKTRCRLPTATNANQVRNIVDAQIASTTLASSSPRSLAESKTLGTKVYFHKMNILRARYLPEKTCRRPILRMGRLNQQLLSSRTRKNQSGKIHQKSRMDRKRNPTGMRIPDGGILTKHGGTIRAGRPSLDKATMRQAMRVGHRMIPMKLVESKVESRKRSPRERTRAKEKTRARAKAKTKMEESQKTPERRISIPKPELQVLPTQS